MGWTLTANDAELINDIKTLEGNIAYQTKLGYFKNGKFVVYKDSLGYPTIGYGHLVGPKENFSAGLTEAQADALLAKDLASTVNDAASIYSQYKMTGDRKLQMVLTQMVFQMGKTKVLQFTGTLSSMAKGDYKAAAKGIRNSLWYKQTTSRAEKMARILESI